MNEVHEIMEKTSLFDDKQITDILLDLSHYEYDKMVVKSMYLLNRFYSGNAHLYDKAFQAQVSQGHLPPQQSLLRQCTPL